MINKRKNIEWYGKRINERCCRHTRKKNKYYIGYSGIRCCKVALCLDCNGIQFVGGKIGKLIYPIVKRIYRNRFEIIGIIDIPPLYDKAWERELERYGRDKQ